MTIFYIILGVIYVVGIIVIYPCFIISGRESRREE
jgi:hypothetical protein